MNWDDEFDGRCDDDDNNDEQKENTCDYYRDEDEQQEGICEHQLGQWWSGRWWWRYWWCDNEQEENICDADWDDGEQKKKIFVMMMTKKRYLWRWLWQCRENGGMIYCLYFVLLTL